jgi:DNA-binding winged helix-turn-helix (wHTH) protein
MEAHQILRTLPRRGYLFTPEIVGVPLAGVSPAGVGFIGAEHSGSRLDDAKLWDDEPKIAQAERLKMYRVAAIG